MATVCDACAGTGILYNTGPEDQPFTVERCDACEGYPSDEEAAKANGLPYREAVDANGFHHIYLEVSLDFGDFTVEPDPDTFGRINVDLHLLDELHRENVLDDFVIAEEKRAAEYIKDAIRFYRKHKGNREV